VGHGGVALGGYLKEIGRDATFSRSKPAILPILAKTADLGHVMIVMTSVEAQNRFGELIDRAQREPIEITRRGRPVAYVIAEHDLKGLRDLSQRREAAMQWYASYRASAISHPEAAALTDDDIDRFVHELR
jgi:antitoxin Phd